MRQYFGRRIPGVCPETSLDYLFSLWIASADVRILAEYPEIQLENDDRAKEFKVIIERTIQKSDVTTQKEALKDSDTIQKSDSTIQKNLDPSQVRVLNFFREHPKATIDEMVAELNGLSLGGVKFIIAKLQKNGLLKRVGGRKHGEWKVLV